MNLLPTVLCFCFSFSLLIIENCYLSSKMAVKICQQETMTVRKACEKIFQPLHASFTSDSVAVGNINYDIKNNRRQIKPKRKTKIRNNKKFIILYQFDYSCRICFITVSIDYASEWSSKQTINIGATSMNSLSKLT